MNDLLLAAVVFLAFTVEASLGFGATVVTVALGAQLRPIEQILPAFVPLNVALSAYMVARYRRELRAAVLARRVLPWMLAGLPLGLYAFARLPARALKLAFGVFVVALALLELARRGDGSDAARQGSERTDGGAAPLPRALEAALLVLGGVAHGAFATGGPMAVYVMGRALARDKAAFRATLAALWLVLNAILLGSYALEGALTAATARSALLLAPALALGLGAGEWLHARVPTAAFRRAVWALLLGAGALLVARR